MGQDVGSRDMNGRCRPFETKNRECALQNFHFCAVNYFCSLGIAN
jgi:hypothetical protein